MDIKSLRDMAIAVVTKRGVRDVPDIGPAMVTFENGNWRIGYVEGRDQLLTIWSQWVVTTRDYKDRLRWHRVLDISWSDDDAIEVNTHRRNIGWESAFERDMRQSNGALV